MANSYNSIGRIYQNLGGFSTSLTYLLEGLAIMQETGNNTTATLNLNMGYNPQGIKMYPSIIAKNLLIALFEMIQNGF